MDAIHDDAVCRSHGIDVGDEREVNALRVLTVTYD
jgi:hypothetical protein